MTNKRTFDEIESDSVLDMLSIELLLYMIIVGNLDNRDITTIAQLNKGYKDILYTNKVYLRKLGHWTIELKRNVPLIHKDICPIRIPGHPPYVVQCRVNYGDADEDLIIIAYQNADLDIRLMAVYSSTTRVKWVRSFPAYGTAYGIEMLVSSLGIVVLTKRLDRIIILDPPSGEDATREYKLPFVFGLCHSLGSIAGRTVITNYMKGEYWIVTVDTENIPIFERIEAEHLFVSKLNEPSDYVVFKRNLYHHNFSDYILTEFPYKHGGKLIELGQLRRNGDLFLRNNEVILAGEFNTRIIDAAKSIKEGSAHIKEDIPTQVDGFKLISVTNDANVFIYDKSAWNGKWYAWYIRAEDMWVYTQMAHQRIAESEIHLHIDANDGTVWYRDDRGMSLYRLGYNSSIVYGGHYSASIIQFIGSHEDTTYIYEA
jgi:hypothetical protein